MFDKIKLWLKKKDWRKRNVHNETSIVNAFNFAQVSVGKGTYGGITAILMADDSYIKIGDYCSIGPKVTFMGGASMITSGYLHILFNQKFINKKLITQ